MPKFNKDKYLFEVYPRTSPIRVKYKDIFDLKAFYSSLREWLSEHDWVDEEDGKDHWESYYGERIDASGGREIWINWRCVKKPENAPFLKYYFDFTWHCIGIKKTEIVKNGKKYSANKGDVELKIWAFIEKKYEKEFDGHGFLKHFRKIFSQRIYRRTLELKKKELYQEAYALQNFVKQWFKLKRYLPYEEAENFFSSYAWPSHQKESE